MDHEQLPECIEAFTKSAEWRKNYGKKLDDMHSALVGNGNPRGGLLSRVAELEGRRQGGDRTWKIIGIGAACVAVLIAILK